MCDYMKVPCKHCPFRTDVKPFLHPERAYEIAASAYNPYNDFTCHNTLEYDDESENGYRGRTSKTCAGWLTIQAREDDRNLPDGFEPSWDIVYEDAYDMEEAYQQEWDKKNNK